MINMLSIIIPTLNEEKYIRKLLNCLANQTYKNFEVIVVDGNSQDKTKEIAKKQLIKPKIINTKKRGVAYQRNLGAKNARYDRLLFLDADITLNNDFLEKSLKEIKKKGLKLASAGIKPDLKNWYYIVFFNTINQIMRVTQYLSKGGFGACLFIDKTLFKKVGGFNTSLNCVVDHDLIQRASKYSRLGFLKTRFTHSVRRFEKHGTKKTMRLWGKEMFYFLTKGPKTVNKKIGYKYGDY